ncbi:hypothetical protein ADUPG1_010168 [Aduncisulcus paluster]|uniref:Uncharacterized protein n=1 Tax=Aduncisulcus paluster TaxID=2918883 RepID=A0ABQ5KY51_9EUKA|nr:hypothetical protein ADUPG1_010168 [Aduncisulcus paluster]
MVEKLLEAQPSLVHAKRGVPRLDEEVWNSVHKARHIALFLVSESLLCPLFIFIICVFPFSSLPTINSHLSDDRMQQFNYPNNLDGKLTPIFSINNVYIEVCKPSLSGDNGIVGIPGLPLKVISSTFCGLMVICYSTLLHSYESWPEYDSWISCVNADGWA